MAFALGIIGEQMYKNLDIIRSVRNAFAHSKIPITFETKEVSAACQLLEKPDLVSLGEFLTSDVVFEHDWERSTTTRMKFMTICNIMATNLARYAHHTDGLRLIARDHETNPTLEIVVKRKSLP
jgi:hypothetical protein